MVRLLEATIPRRAGASNMVKCTIDKTGSSLHVGLSACVSVSLEGSMWV